MALVAPPPPKPGESSAAYRQRVQAWRDHHETVTMRVFTAVLVCFLIFIVIAFITGLSYQPPAPHERPKESFRATETHPDRPHEFLYALETQHDA